MRLLSIFLSSTCFDLKSLREHLRSEITSWGHDPVLSEYNSFPVSPDLTTVENCKKVIRERADVLVLIVGGKRGSLDQKTNRSVVNLEYLEARATGLDCIVFVDRDVWTLRTTYEKNPNADFSPVVDNPEVFRFLNELLKETKWIFQFTNTNDILTTLRIQLSARLRDLLIRSRENRLTVPTEFALESREISRIALDKGSKWEFKLASELLHDRIKRLDLKYTELESGLVVRRTRYLAGPNTISFIRDLVNDLKVSIQVACKILAEQLTPAFGPLGTPGDAVAIKRACDNIYSVFLSLYEWELDVRFIRPHNVLVDLFQSMQGWTKELLIEFRRIPTELDKILSSPNITGNYFINLVINPPKGMEAFNKKFDKISNDPDILAVLAGND